MAQSGIYRIVVNRPNGPRFYIGQAIDLSSRRSHHLARLRNGTHKNKKLQSAFSLHGEDAFSFEAILVCSKETSLLRTYEQIILDFYIATVGGSSVYNVHRNCVSSRLGIPVSEETRNKMRAAAAGRKPSIACIEAGRKYNTGRKLSPESIALRTSKQTGLKRAPKTCAALSAALSGRTLSIKTRAKISKSKKGWQPSDAHRERMRELGSTAANRERMAAVARGPGRLAKIGTKKSPEEMERRNATRRSNAILRGAVW